MSLQAPPHWPPINPKMRHDWALEPATSRIMDPFFSCSTPLPSSEALRFTISDAEENSSHKPTSWRAETAFFFHSNRPTYTPYLIGALLAPLWPGFATSQRVPLPLLPPHRRYYPATALRRPRPVIRRANEPVPLDLVYELETLARNSALSEDITIPAEYQKRTRHQYDHGVAEENHQGDGAPPKGAVRPLTTPTEPGDRGRPGDFI